MRSRPRLRSALALAAAALTAASAVALAAPAPATACRTRQAAVDGPWQQFALPAYRAVDGVAAARVTATYGVDPSAPFRVVVSDGTTVHLSDDGGCTFREVLALEAVPSTDVPLSGRDSRITSVVLTDRRRVLLLVQQADGPAARPHVIGSDSGERGTWSLADEGLPRAGTPGPAVAAPGGATVHLAVRPPAQDAPLQGPAGARLLTSRDGGRTWSPAGADPTLPTAPDRLAADREDPELLWVAAGGRLHVSDDGGRSVRPVGPSGLEVDALAPRERRGQLAVLGRAGGGPGGWRTEDAGGSFSPFPAPAVTSAAARASDPGVVLVSTPQGRVLRIALQDGASRDVTPRVPGPVRQVASDRSAAPSWSALSDTRLLRWVDPTRTGLPVLADGLDTPPAPRPARVEPAQREVSLGPGARAQVDFEVALPPSPTPLDLVLLVDNSDSMGPVIEDLRAGLRDLAATLLAGGLDLRLGLATAGSLPRDGRPEPVADPRYPDYRRPVVYERLAAVRPPDAQFFGALSELRVQTPHPDSTRRRIQGQLLGVDQLLHGSGVRAQSAGPAPVYDVPPDQVAGWRQSDRVRRLLVNITDHELEAPRGTPVDADGRPAIARVGAALRAARIVHVGFTNGPEPGAERDLGLLSAATGARAPAGGLDCDGDGARDVAPGAPLVCPTATAYTAGVLAAVRALPDLQPLRARPRAPSTVLQSVSLPARVDVAAPARVPLSVRVACARSARPSRHDVVVDVLQRDVVVGQARVLVTCSALAAPAQAPAAPAAPGAPPAAEPAPPAAAVPPPVPPAAPVAAPAPAQAPQPQGQPQPNLQYGAAEQEQPDPALALAGVLLDPDDTAQPAERRADATPWQLALPALLSLGVGTAVARRRAVPVRG